MANLKVRLMRLCKTEQGWKRFPAVVGGNGRIKPGYVLVKGQEVHFPDGRYQLRVYQGDRMVYVNAGQNASDARTACDRHSHLLAAKHSAKAAGLDLPGTIKERNTISKKKLEFIDRLLSKNHTRASETAAIAIDDFTKATRLVYLDEVNEAAILKFYKHLRQRGNADRTVYNKHMSLFGFLKWAGVNIEPLPEPPTYTEREVEVFDPEDLKILFARCTAYQKVVFETLLKTGMRMQEAMNLEWENIDFRSKKIKVREYHQVSIKDRAERSTPLSDDLAETLKEWRKVRPKSRLVLGTRNDTPNWKWLQMLKRVVNRVELNCGRCKGCLRTKECSRWKLKTFRSTYTTTMLRNGIDARTVMSWTGHADLATVLKYLAPSTDPGLQKQVSSIKWTT